MRRVAWALNALIILRLLLSLRPSWAAEITKKPAEPQARVLADATSGRVLREQRADEPVALGSLGQLMIALLALERVDAGELRLDRAIPISADVAGVPGARLGLHNGDQIPLGECLRALIVSGAPDATIAVAVAVAGTAADAVIAMNERARSLGLIGTEYGSLLGNAEAMRQPVDVTTARDTAKLTAELLRHAIVLEWAALSGIPFRDGAVLLRNRNQLLGTVTGANGLLVTEVPRIGFHAIATARRGSLQLISITLAAPDNAVRYAATAEWLEWGFNTFERIDIVRAGEPLLMPIRLHAGIEDRLVPIAAAGYSLLRRRDEERHFELGFQVPDVVTAPVARDQRIGEIIVREDGQVLAVVAAVSPADFAAADGVLSAAGKP